MPFFCALISHEEVLTSGFGAPFRCIFVLKLDVEKYHTNQSHSLLWKARSRQEGLTRGFNVSGPKDVCGVGREAGESDAELPQSHTADCPEVSVLLERQEAALAQVHSDCIIISAHVFRSAL